MSLLSKQVQDLCWNTAPYDTITIVYNTTETEMGLRPSMSSGYYHCTAIATALLTTATAAITTPIATATAAIIAIAIASTVHEFSTTVLDPVVVLLLLLLLLLDWAIGVTNTATHVALSLSYRYNSTSLTVSETNALLLLLTLNLLTPTGYVNTLIEHVSTVYVCI